MPLDPRFDPPTKKQYWYTEGAICPIFDPEGELLKNVHICFDWCNPQGNEYEISDVRYGSIDGVLLPDWDDIVQAIQEKLGLGVTLILPDKFTHDLKL